MDCYCHKWKGL